jgi:hypothetical protein
MSLVKQAEPRATVSCTMQGQMERRGACEKQMDKIPVCSLNAVYAYVNHCDQTPSLAQSWQTRS